ENALLAERASAVIFRGLDAGVFTGELRDRFLEECDYLQEAANQRELGRLWAGPGGVVIPRVFAELTTKRMPVTDPAPAARRAPAGEAARRGHHVSLRRRGHLPPRAVHRRSEPGQLPLPRRRRDVPGL